MRHIKITRDDGEISLMQVMPGCDVEAEIKKWEKTNELDAQSTFKKAKSHKEITEREAKKERKKMRARHKKRKEAEGQDG